MTTVLVPLRSEAVAVRLGLRGDAFVQRTGAGPHRAASAPLPAGGPTIVLGVCGALDDTRRPGDVVVADRLITPEGAIIAAYPGAADLAAALHAAGLPASAGAIAGSDRLVRGDAQRRQLARSGAVAVDLESSVLAGRGEDVVVVRVVVDTPGHELLRPATITHGLRALATLRRTAPLVVRWTAAHILTTPRS